MRARKGGSRASGRGAAPRTTLPRALHAEALRLRRSPLVPLHLSCALAAGLACGAYFAYAPWDPAMGSDAFVQLLGALMPLMAGIVCGLDADGEGEATGLSALLSVPSRRIALSARLCVLWLMGTAALALSLGTFATVLHVAGRSPFGAGVWVLALAGLSLGSILLYLLLYAVALRWGRNVAIAVGAAGLMLAFFSVGGLVHGLMTGELTAVGTSAFGLVPACWSARLGSLGVELFVSGRAGAVAAVLARLAGACVVATALLAVAVQWWVSRFEPARRGE